MALGFTDIVVLTVYFVGTILVGYISGKKEKGTEDFFLGGRRMPWYAVMFSILATEASAVTFIGVPADAFRGNYIFLQWAAGSIVARFLIAYLFLPAFFRGKVTTVYEFLEQRFGPSSRNTATLFFFCTRLLASGVRLLAAAMALSVVTNLSLAICICLAALVAMLYTTVGGIKAVIWTDVLQILIFFGGAVIAVIYLLGEIPGGLMGTIGAAVPQGKMQVFDFRFDLNSPTFFLVGLINGFFLTFAALGTDQDMTQRMLTCQRTKDSQRAIILTGFIDVPIILTFLFIGTQLFLFYGQADAVAPPDNTDYVFPHFIVNFLPMGLRGLLIAGVFAAAMSSLDSALGALTSSAVVDIYKRVLHKEVSEAHLLKVSRLLVVLFGAVLVIVAIICSRFGGILWLAFKIASFSYGALLGVFLLGVLSRSTTDRGNSFAMGSSVAILICLALAGDCVPISWPWYVVIGTVWTYVVGLVIDRFRSDGMSFLK